MVKSALAMQSAFLVMFGCSAQSPTAPSNLQCASMPGGQPGQLAAQVDVDPSSVDMVSFMVARADDPEKWPFIQYSVPVGVSDGSTVSGTISGLEAGAEYLLMARAHTRNQTTSYYIYWSEVSHKEAPCKAAGVGSESAAAHAPSAGTRVPSSPGTGAADTAWLEVFRYNGNSLGKQRDPRNNITLPDYIEAHNTADLKGMFSNRWSTIYDRELQWNASITRYCVEMEVVELHGVTTPTDWVPSTSQFSDYFPCTAGQCYCMSRIDREVTRQPTEDIVANCGPAEPGHVPGSVDKDGEAQRPCKICDAERSRESQKYIGRVRRFGNGGSWFSNPPGGHCAPGAQIGDAGCTFRLSPLSHSLSIANLYSKGVFNDADISHWWSEQQLEVARAAFDGLGVEPCGGRVATAIHNDIIMA